MIGCASARYFAWPHWGGNFQTWAISFAPSCSEITLDHPVQYNGDNMLVHNSAFSYNDWVGQGNLGTVMDKASSGEFSQNTLYYNGPAHGLRYIRGVTIPAQRPVF